MSQSKLNKYLLKNPHLTKDTDIKSSDIQNLFELTDIIKKKRKNNTDSKLLPGKTLGMIFEKSSTRTRVSFQVGMYQLGGQAFNLSSEHIQISRGESVEDTAQVLSRYLDAIMIRTYSQERIESLAANSIVPVINGLSDSYHPCQILTDFYTIYKVSKKKVCLAFIGDCASNVAISLALTGSRLGHKLIFCSPENYRLPDSIWQQASAFAQQSGAMLIREIDPKKAVLDAEFLYTDVWVSMGKEKEVAQRLKAFKNYTIDMALIEKAKSTPYILHCLPANWGQEIAQDVKNYKRNLIFDQAENRLHVQKAILFALMHG